VAAVSRNADRCDPLESFPADAIGENAVGSAKAAGDTGSMEPLYERSDIPTFWGG
jgi:hypothetical protein